MESVGGVDRGRAPTWPESRLGKAYRVGRTRADDDHRARKNPRGDDIRPVNPLRFILTHYPLKASAPPTSMSEGNRERAVMPLATVAPRVLPRPGRPQPVARSGGARRAPGGRCGRELGDRRAGPSVDGDVDLRAERIGQRLQEGDAEPGQSGKPRPPSCNQTRDRWRAPGGGRGAIHGRRTVGSRVRTGGCQY
jgi:hypothetical protein